MLLNLSILTILLSIVLGLFNWNKSSNSLFLAGFFFISSSFGIAHHYVFHEKEVFATALLFNHLVPFMFLIGPFILFYVRGALNEERRLKTIDILHFIPAIVSGIGTMPYYMQSLETKLKIAEQLIANLNSLRSIDVNLFYDAGESFFYRTVLCLVYVLYSLYKVFQKQRIFKNRSTPMTRQEKQVMQWLWILLLALLSISFIFLFLALQTAAYSIKEVIAYSYPYYLLSGVIYFIMALSLFQFPNVLYGLVPRESVPGDIEEVDQQPALIKKKKEIKKREKPYGEGTVKERMALYLETEKPYVNSEFSVFSIAIALELSESEVNSCIKNELHTTFVKLRTAARVNHALQLLENKSINRLTIEAIGEKSGFKTRSNFYAAFKDATGLTPTEFIQQK